MQAAGILVGGLVGAAISPWYFEGDNGNRPSVLRLASFDAIRLRQHIRNVDLCR
jgi:hypothetical protein